MLIVTDLFVDGSDEHGLELHAGHLRGPEAEVKEHGLGHLHQEHQHGQHVARPRCGGVLGRRVVYQQPTTVTRCGELFFLFVCFVVVFFNAQSTKYDVDNWILTPRGPRRSYQGEKVGHSIKPCHAVAESSADA